MTAAEKAKELVDKFTFKCKECDYDWNAKQCALIAVDECIKTAAYMPETLHFWNKVKLEIEKL